MVRPPFPTVDVQVGTPGNDQFFGFAIIPHDYLGLGGNDTLVGTAFRDTLDGGDGSDFIRDGDPLGVAAVADTLLGGAGDDFIFAAAAAAPDLIDGGAGFDRLFFTLATDADLSMTGRFGSGTVTFSNGQVISGIEFASISFGNGDNALFTGRFGASLSTGGGNDTLIGAGAGDTLAAGGGDNRLEGRGGNDFLSAFGGNNILLGGAGDDVLAGSGTLRGGIGDDALSGFGSATLVGGAGADLFDQSFTGLSRVLDFDAAEGDRVRVAVPPPIDPDIIVADPFGDGFVRVVDGAEGAELQFRAQGNVAPDDPFVTVSVFVGVTAAELLPNVLIA